MLAFGPFSFGIYFLSHTICTKFGGSAGVAIRLLILLLFIGLLTLDFSLFHSATLYN
jgi:cellulose synthase/poly-beta-1,6-N-acetylglucosamine synthase-like glycosyltransferase